MGKLFWKRIIFILDMGIIIYTPIYLLYKLIPLFYLLMGHLVDRVIFDMRSANILGSLFIITIIKLVIGIVCFLILQIKYKQNLLKNNHKYYINLWIIFSIFILSYSIVLLITKTYNSYYNFFYSILIIIGTICWLKIILNNMYIKKNI